ncbi:inhibitor of nuclear factor kappa-B kinase-interacting protein isoform X3 [Triplophysa rosa]|uniref:inhibitor of nuclear factor kappa-B kinase-interacting protein isoform X3 n=1 Tax=Triplophysa rosa TaxID=992332 RepID=UPI002545D56F|nr:inhibitor of nuclear factor kappa-B kinase-interacting protein isoform X3 [Triplophysa rosa]
MQSRDVKQRKKASDAKENGEKRRPEEKDEDKSKRDAEERKHTRSSDVKLVLSLVALAVSVVVMWILYQHSSRFTEIKEQYDDLYEKTRRVLELQSQMSSVSDKLQASVDELLSSTTRMTQLRHDITSIHDTSTALQEHQETSSLQYQTLNKRFQNVTETWQSRVTAVTDDLSALKTDSRSTHGRVTNHVNSVDGRVRVLSERLQELEDGIKRNTRVLDRTEEEDARRVQELLDWNSRRFSEVQERLRLVGRLRDELQKRLEKTIPRVQQWESRLPDVEESVRSMLRVRAQLSETERRLTELTLQVQRTEEKISD